MAGKNPKQFTEATRVQMPALVHLTRLGYQYFGKISEEGAGTVYDPDTNILIDIFTRQFQKLNPGHEGEAAETLRLIRQELDNDDLGKSFYSRLKSVSPVRLIDFEHPEANTWHCTAEFTCKRDGEEFRPDITLFVNGLPLVFVEVKKPFNRDGMLAESERMNHQRFPNRKFRRFLNITQLMIFSNNMDYDTLGGTKPVEGAFYCTVSRDKANLNCFREENPYNAAIAPYNKNYQYIPERPETEKKILTDFNCQVIRQAPEYQTNKGINTPTNRILTSMCSPERLLFLLRYGIAYVRMDREVDGKIEFTDQKHIMRYQQFFACQAISRKIRDGVRSGIVWHTQGSGKTALSYYLTYVLTDVFAKQSKVTKFYFIVDRLDLLEQATQEFEARGLFVQTANTRSELMSQFTNNQALEGNAGKPEIIVVNIHRFAEDKNRVNIPEYATNLQRVFIVDEAHRGYRPEGSFLANLFEADPNSIKIALTGTPLLKEERASWKVFGNYLHTYYYDKSIQDGYTLKIIREEIETSYKDRLSEIYDSLENLIQKKDVKKSDIIEHERYVKELLRYIITDLQRFRVLQGDQTLGGMIICETSEQARRLYAYFDDVKNELNRTGSDKYHLRAGLILFDSDDKEIRKQIISGFKKNFTVDVLIVYNMLLTGFDAPRLKRLYLGRKLKDHNLLQALTRVNRPYKENHYGYVIDFADIKRNFDETNQAYLDELNRFNDPEGTGEGQEGGILAQVMEDPDALLNQMRQARQVLFPFTKDNAEEFSREVADIPNKDELFELKKALITLRDSINVVRTFGDDELKKTVAAFEISRLPEMLSEVQRAINLMNQKQYFTDSDHIQGMINEAMMDITFDFRKISEEELKLTSGSEELNEKFSRAVREFTQNIDKEDPEYITLHEAFVQRFKEHGFTPESIDVCSQYSKTLDEVLEKLKSLKKKNDALGKKYSGDEKFVRVHKRIREENEKRAKEKKPPILAQYDDDILGILQTIKLDVDQKVYDRSGILKLDEYFKQTVMKQVTECLKSLMMQSTPSDRRFICDRITAQYLNQYKAVYY